MQVRVLIHHLLTVQAVTNDGDSSYDLEKKLTYLGSLLPLFFF